MGCAGAMRAYRSAERMIEGLCVRAAHFHLSLDEPLPRLLIEAGRITVVVLIVAVIFVPTRVDDSDVAGTDLGTRLLQIFRSDDFPLFLRNGHHDAGPEEIGQRNFVHERRSLNDVGRGIDVSARVHHGRDSLRQYAGLRHAVKPLDLDVLEIRPAWLPKSPGVAQIVKLQSHTVEKIGFLELTKIRIAPIAVLPTSHVVPLMYRTAGIVYGHTVRHRDAPRQDIAAKALCSRATSASLDSGLRGLCIDGTMALCTRGPAAAGASTGQIRPALREHGLAPRGGALRASPGLCESAWSGPESTRRSPGPLDPEIQCRPPRCAPHAPRCRLPSPWDGRSRFPCADR